MQNAKLYGLAKKCLKAMNMVAMSSDKDGCFVLTTPEDFVEAKIKAMPSKWYQRDTKLNVNMDAVRSGFSSLARKIGEHEDDTTLARKIINKAGPEQARCRHGVGTVRCRVVGTV